MRFWKISSTIDVFLLDIIDFLIQNCVCENYDTSSKNYSFYWEKKFYHTLIFLKIINLNLHENVIVLHIFRKFCEKKCDIFNCERPAPRHDTKTLYKFHLTFKNFNPKFDAFITNFDRIKSIVVLMQIIC